MEEPTKIILNQSQLCDYELIADGSLFPLQGFMSEDQYKNVLDNLELDGSPFGLPVYLSVKRDQLQEKQIKLGQIINLANQLGNTLCEMKVESIYTPNLVNECLKSLGTTDENHPYVGVIMKQNDHVYIGGKFEKIISNVVHYDYQELRMNPASAKKFFKENNWNTIIAFQTRNPMHKSHYHLTLEALKQTNDKNAKLLIHPTVGITQKSDIDYHTRVRCYIKILKYYQQVQVKLGLLNLQMRMAGPREALQHAIIRQNYGCTHFIVGRDHAGPSSRTKQNQQFYGPYDAQELLKKVENKLKIKIIYGISIEYVEKLNSYLNEKEVQEKNLQSQSISGTNLRDMLRNGEQIPEWYTFKEVSEELSKDLEFQPSFKKGFAIYLVGLSGAGKTTIAENLYQKFKEILPQRTIDLLDADEIRKNLSSGLGFSKEDRSKNVQRIGYLAAKIVKHRGIAIIANIAPYKEDRFKNKQEIKQFGGYIQVFVNTPIQECENRDPKGLYKKFRRGEMKNLTGLDDPFEEPSESEIILDGTQIIQQSIDQIIKYLEQYEFIESQKIQQSISCQSFQDDQSILNSEQKFCFITGITGQDGGYLASYLLTLGYKVFALKRKSCISKELHCWRLKQIIDQIEIYEGDLTDQISLIQILSSIKQKINGQKLEIYHLAAQTDVHYSFAHQQETYQINIMGTQNLLSAIQTLGMIKQVRFYNSASSEMFGNSPSPQNEKTLFNPRSPYAISKLSCFYAVKNLSEAQNFYGVNGILFNHESPKRGENFILQKIVKGAINIINKNQQILFLGNLNSKRDIGYSLDYVKAMHLMLQQKQPQDFVIGSGYTYQIKTLVELVFKNQKIGIIINWRGQGKEEIGYSQEGQEIIKIDPNLYRELEVDELRADTTKAENILQWKCNTSIESLIKIMIDEEFEKIKQL